MCISADGGLYETMVYWETADGESGCLAEHVEFAQIWKALPKVVFSRTLESVVGNTRLARDGVGEEVSSAQGASRKGHRGRRGRPRRCVYEAGADRRVAAVRQPGPTRRRHALLPDPGRRDQPGVGRDEDVWLSRRLPSLQARAGRRVGDVPTRRTLANHQIVALASERTVELSTRKAAVTDAIQRLETER